MIRVLVLLRYTGSSNTFSFLLNNHQRLITLPWCEAASELFKQLVPPLPAFLLPIRSLHDEMRCLGRSPTTVYSSRLRGLRKCSWDEKDGLVCEWGFDRRPARPGSVREFGVDLSYCFCDSRGCQEANSIFVLSTSPCVVF